MANKNGYRVLIVGCGQLGSRHLQAVAAIPGVREIEVVDPFPESLALGRRRLEEVADLQPDTAYRWLSSLEQASKSGDFCIVATQADVRCDVVREVANNLEYPNFLLEKIVAESVSDYKCLMGFSKDIGLGVWVNCQSRAHPAHIRVKAHLNPGEPIIYNVMGGNHGLATNGIHAADLFAFHDDADVIHSAGSQIDPTLHASKRGQGMYDLSGTLQGSTESGSRFNITYAADHTGPQHFAISSSSYRSIIDETQEWFFESTQESGWSWRQVPFQGDTMVSRMTKKLASDIMESGRCDLPTLDQCFAAHSFILSELLPVFKKLTKVKDDRCPVT